MVLVTLTLDMNGILSEKMLDYCKKYSIKEEDLIIQCLEHCAYMDFLNI